MDLEVHCNKDKITKYEQPEFDFFTELSKDVLDALKKNNTDSPLSEHLNSFMQNESSSFLNFLMQSLEEKLHS